MSIVQYTMKTHSREDVTDQYHELSTCIIHGTPPKIVKMVVGRRKEIVYVANCQHDDCGKIGHTGDEVVGHWQKWNSKQNQ